MTDVISQERALAFGEMGPDDAARFWRAERHDRLECLAARFRTHRYAPHSHDTYVIGVITAGWEGYWLRGARRLAGPGELCFVNPGEVHDGEPVADFYAYRMSYPSEGFLRDLAEDLTGRSARSAPAFAEAVVQDAEAARLFVAAHRRLEGGGMALEQDEQLVAALSLILLRHSDLGAGAARTDAPSRAVQRACDYLDSCFAEDVTLARLSEVAGLRRTELVRAFRRQTGLTPHAWLTDRRVRAAQALLRHGEAPGQVAAATGFFDQAHFTRAFKARLGVTPGAYRRAGSDRP